MNKNDLDIVMQALAQEQQAPQVNIQQSSSQQPMTDLEIVSKALSGMQEDPGKLALPLGSNPIKQLEPSQPESSKHPLDADWMSDPFVRDFRVATGYDPRTLVLEKGTQAERRAITPREAFHAAVATGLLTPDTENPDPETLQAFGSQWNAYKNDMDVNIIGAAGRGAKSNIGATIGGTTGFLMGSPAGLVGSIPMGFALGAAGGYVQDVVSPPTTEDIAFRAFDNSKQLTRISRLAGELIPSLATMRPTANAPLIKLATPAIKEALAGTIFSAGFPAALDAIQGNDFDSERFLVNTLGGIFMKPNKFGQYLFDKHARTERAAQGVAQKLWNKYTERQKDYVVPRLRAYNDLYADGIQPMSGEIAGTEALVAFQQALRNKDEVLRQRQADNFRAASLAVDEKLPLTRTVDEQPTRQFIQHEHNVMDAAAQQTRNDLRAKGHVEAESILAAAQAQSDALNQLREQGIISARHAHDAAQRVYTEAIADVNSRMGAPTNESQMIDDLIKARKKEQQTIIDDESKKLPLGATTDFENSYKAALKVSKQSKGLITDLPPLLQRILREYAPTPTKKGLKPPMASLRVLKNDLEALTQEANVATEAGRRNDARMLNEVKKGMEADFDAAGNLWEPVKAFRQLYKKYSETYLHGTLGAETGPVPKSDITFRLNNILNGKSGTEGIEAPFQLRAAIQNNPDGIEAVAQHMLKELSRTDHRTSSSIERWIKSTPVERVLEAFPEARGRLEDVLISFKDKEILMDREKRNIEKAKEVPKSKITEAEKQRAKLAVERANVEASEWYTREQKMLSAKSFQAFIGNDPTNAVQKVMSSGDPIQSAHEIVALCKKDPTGEALAGFQNAVRQFLKDTVYRTGEVTGSSNDITKPIEKNEFAISFGKANAALEKDSKLRKVMEAVLPPSELQALDAVRRQVEAISRPTRNANGQSTTAPTGAFSKAMQEKMDENVLGLLGRIARGWSVDKAVSTKTTRTLDFLQRLYFGQVETPIEKMPGLKGALKGLAEEFGGWSGKDVATRSMEILRDSMLDPKLAADLIESKVTSPRTRALFRAYFINRDQYMKDAPTLPFNSMNTTETDLPNGKLIRDRSTGYMITNTGKKFVVQNYKDQRVGLYDTLEEARNAAVKDWAKPTANIKLRKD